MMTRDEWWGRGQGVGGRIICDDRGLRRYWPGCRFQRTLRHEERRRHARATSGDPRCRGG